MDESFIISLVLGLIICAFVGNYISKQKGRDTTEGVLFGLLGGIIGLIIVALLPNKSKPEKSEIDKKPPSQKAIQKAKNNDFIGRIIGIVLLVLVVIGFIYYKLNEE